MTISTGWNKLTAVRNNPALHKCSLRATCMAGFWGADAKCNPTHYCHSACLERNSKGNIFWINWGEALEKSLHLQHWIREL